MSVTTICAWLPYYSGTPTVKPTTRAKPTTPSQQASETAPASLPAGATGTLRSHLDTLRKVMNSNSAILMPAASINSIFILNAGFPTYCVAWLMNSSDPLIAAMANAAQVHGSTSRHSSVAARLLEPSPSRRRSTIAMVPNTSVMAMTCTISIAGKAMVDCAMESANDVFSSQLSNPVTFSTARLPCVVASPPEPARSVRVGNQAPGRHDAEPEQ